MTLRRNRPSNPTVGGSNPPGRAAFAALTERIRSGSRPVRKVARAKSSRTAMIGVQQTSRPLFTAIDEESTVTILRAAS